MGNVLPIPYPFSSVQTAPFTTNPQKSAFLRDLGREGSSPGGPRHSAARGAWRLTISGRRG
jgi:hypothetical protein